MERLPGLAAELVRSKVDLIVATSLQPARAAAAATSTIPIVFVVAADPVGQGLVSDLARPGGNITGLAMYEPREISERVLQLLREATIKVSRLAVLMNPSNPVHRDLMAQALPSAARKAGVTLLPLDVQSLSELQRAFDAAQSASGPTRSTCWVTCSTSCIARASWRWPPSSASPRSTRREGPSRREG